MAKYLDEAGTIYLIGKIVSLLNEKVDKEEGKSLSSEDFSLLLKEKLENLENYTLPIANEETLGGIKVGTGLTINSETGELTSTGGEEAAARANQSAIVAGNYAAQAQQTIDNALANAPFAAEETGVIDHDNVGWYTQDTSNYYVMTGTYSKIGDFCFLQVTARLKNTWQNISYSLPMAATAPAQTIVAQDGVQYIITVPTMIDNSSNYSVLDIKKFDGTAFSSDDTIQFTLIYQV